MVNAERPLLVDVEAVKAYPGISISPTDHSLDGRLEQFIAATQPLIEQITGPIIPQTFDETYDGGSNVISLTHRPSVGYGTAPLLTIVACSEFLGPVEYKLTQVANASLGTFYSFQVNTRLGTVTRRTSGGGTMIFPIGPETVRIVYTAGQAQVPANVQEAVLELVRVNFETTQAVGAGRQTMTDQLDGNQKPLGFFLPRNVRELLSPMARGPSIA